MRRSATGLALLGLLFTALPARAELVTYQFNGVLNYEWANPNWLLEGEFLEDMTEGSPFSMTLTWDTDAPVQSVTAPDTATYLPAFTAFSAFVDGFMFTIAPGRAFGQLAVSNGSGTTPDVLSGTIIDERAAGQEWGDAGLSLTKWQLFFPSTTWSDSEIPNELPTEFSRGGAALYFASGDNRQGKVGALLTGFQQVPEPSFLMLWGVGLFTAARMMRSKKATRTRTSPQPEA